MNEENNYVRAQRQVIYFVQADELRLIKIGMASNVDKRVRDLSNTCPDTITVLGVQICYRYGALETELHLRFADDRVRGEWFDPTDELLRYIRDHASDQTKAIDRLNAIARFPLTKRGRPSRAMKAQMGLVGLEKWR